MFGNKLLTIIFLLLLFTLQTSFAESTKPNADANQTEATVQTTPDPSLKADITDPENYRLYWQNTSLAQHISNDNEHSLWSLLNFEYHQGTQKLSSLYQHG